MAWSGTPGSYKVHIHIYEIGGGHSHSPNTLNLYEYLDHYTLGKKLWRQGTLATSLSG